MRRRMELALTFGEGRAPASVKLYTLSGEESDYNCITRSGPRRAPGVESCPVTGSLTLPANSFGGGALRLIGGPPYPFSGQPPVNTAGRESARALSRPFYVPPMPGITRSFPLPAGRGSPSGAARPPERGGDGLLGFCLGRFLRLPAAQETVHAFEAAGTA